MTKRIILKDLDPNKLYEISKSQNMVALCWYYIKKNNITVNQDTTDKYKKDFATTVYYRNQQNRAYDSLVNIFNESAISFLPLKGLALMKYYEYPQLRYSCDLDILIHSYDLLKIKNILIKNGWTTDGVLHFHDMSFYKEGIHLELHFNICENMTELDYVLADVWKYAVKVDKYEFALSSDFLMFHQVAHAYYHYCNGGCGAKAILDIKVLKDSLTLSDNFYLFLEQAHIENFYNDIISLIEYWFEGRKATEKNLEMEKYILDGGAYGNRENMALLKDNESEIKRLIKRLVLPKNVMFAYYPTLDKYHFLLPVYHIIRWHRAFMQRVLGKKNRDI